MANIVKENLDLIRVLFYFSNYKENVSQAAQATQAAQAQEHKILV